MNGHEQKAEERLARQERLVEELDRVATKQSSAAESMCEAANSIAESMEEFGLQVQNLEATLSRDRERRRTGG